MTGRKPLQLVMYITLIFFAIIDYIELMNENKVLHTTSSWSDFIKLIGKYSIIPNKIHSIWYIYIKCSGGAALENHIQFNQVKEDPEQRKQKAITFRLYIKQSVKKFYPVI